MEGVDELYGCVRELADGTRAFSQADAKTFIEGDDLRILCFDLLENPSPLQSGELSVRQIRLRKEVVVHDDAVQTINVEQSLRNAALHISHLNRIIVALSKALSVR